MPNERSPSRNRDTASRRDNSGAMASLSARPPRASLVNMATGDSFEFLFNPDSFDEKFEAKFNRTTINGLSHERLSYINTTNDVIPIELYMSQLAQDTIAGEGGSRPYVGTQRKRWLQSLVYPTEDSDYGYTGPPSVLFIWPRMVRIIGRVTRVEFFHQAFSPRTLATTQLLARVTIEEDVARRRLMDEVLRIGSLAAPVEGESSNEPSGDR